MIEVPHFLERIIESGIDVSIVFKNNQFAFTIGGFYKSGDITLVEHNGSWVAKSRYDREDHIDDLDDLVRLNYDWWDRSKDRFDGWKEPDRKWRMLLLEFGYDSF